MIKTYYISVSAPDNVLTSRVPILNPLGGIRSIDQRMWLYEGYPSPKWVTRWNRYPVLWTNPHLAYYQVHSPMVRIELDEDMVNLTLVQYTLKQLNT